MKVGYLSLRFMKKNIFPFMVVCLVMTVSVALIISAGAAYQYQAVTRDALNGEVLQNAVFFTTPIQEADSDELNRALPADVLDSPAYGGALSIEHGGIVELNGDIFFNLKYCNRNTIQAFILPMQSGRWLDPNAKIPEAVLSAHYKNILSLGDSLPLKNGNTAVVVGFVKEKVPFPSLSSWGSTSSASALFHVGMDIALIYEPGRQQTKVTNLVTAVLIRSDASAEAQNTLRARLFSYGSAVSYDKLIERTDEDLRQNLRETLPLPMFLLLVSAVSMLSVTAFAVDQSMSEQSKYFLLGCSKRRSVWVISLSLSVIFSLPIVINLVLIATSPDFLRFDLDAYLIGSYAVLPVLIYWIVCLLLAIPIPVLLYGRYSPLALYRRNL